MVALVELSQLGPVFENASSPIIWEFVFMTKLLYIIKQPAYRFMITSLNYRSSVECRLKILTQYYIKLLTLFGYFLWKLCMFFVNSLTTFDVLQKGAMISKWILV